MERLIRRTPEEKLEIIYLVEHSNLSVKQTLKELGVPRSTFSHKTLGRRTGGTGCIRKMVQMV